MISNNLINDFPRGRNIITVTEALNYMNNDGSKNNSSITGFVQNCISAVARTFENYTQTGLKINDYVGYYDYSSSNQIYLNNIPLVSISSVQYRLDPTQTYQDISPDLSSNIILYNNYIEFYNISFNINYSKQAFKIEYSAGFSECPWDLKKIACEAVSQMFEESKVGQGNLGLKSRTVSNTLNETVGYDNLEPKWKNILDCYKRIII